MADTTMPVFGTGARSEDPVEGVISLELVGELESGDYGGKMKDTLYHMGCDRRYNHEREYTECHEYILRIAVDMERDGWSGPPLLIVDREGSYVPTVENGHHRYNAAVLAGLTEVPNTSSWSTSEGSGDDEWF